MKIGIFDSGLGGLIVAKAIREAMPEYDYVYLGDTKRVPYGNRSHEAVYEFTKEAMNYLFKKENCAIVIVACNTASARALRRLQREYLTSQPPLLIKERGKQSGGEVYPRILGVLIPSAEEAAKHKRVGILATAGTVQSDTFPNEIKKINRHTQVLQNAAPMLVPLAEEREKKMVLPFLKKYLKPVLAKKPEALVLGCTHYPFFKSEIKKISGRKVRIISQDEIVPKKLKDYLIRHPELEKRLAKNGKAKILVTDITQNVKKLAEKWFGKQKPELVNI